MQIYIATLSVTRVNRPGTEKWRHKAVIRSSITETSRVPPSLVITVIRARNCMRPVRSSASWNRKLVQKTLMKICMKFLTT